MVQRPHHLLTGVVVSTLSTYDFKYRSYEQGISINAMLIGLTYTLEHPGLIKGKSNAFNNYFGIGITHLFQFQYGLSGSWRFRSDVVVLNRYSPWFSYTEDERWNWFRKGTVVSVIADHYQSWTGRNWSISLGIGGYF